MIIIQQKNGKNIMINVHGLEINYGNLLLFYDMKPPDCEAFGVLRLLGP